MKEYMKIIGRLTLLLLGIFFLFIALDIWFFPHPELLYPGGIITANIVLGFTAWSAALRI